MLIDESFERRDRLIRVVAAVFHHERVFAVSLNVSEDTEGKFDRLKGMLPELLMLVLRPKGKLQIRGEHEVASPLGWSKLACRWKVVELWKVPAEDLLATARGGSYAEGIGVVLPCYWIYWEAGKELLRRGSPDPRYQRWIDTYSSEEFGKVVREVLSVTDRLGPALAPDERARLHRHFRATSRYEWMFWDMGYRKETWPAFP